MLKYMKQCNNLKSQPSEDWSAMSWSTTLQCFSIFWWRYRRRICHLDLCTYVRIEEANTQWCICILCRQMPSDIKNQQHSESYKRWVATLIRERFFQYQWAIHWIHRKSIGECVTQSFWYPWVTSPDPLCSVIFVLIRRGSSDNSSRHRSLGSRSAIRCLTMSVWRYVCSAFLYLHLYSIPACRLLTVYSQVPVKVIYTTLVCTYIHETSKMVLMYGLIQTALSWEWLDNIII